MTCEDVNMRMSCTMYMCVARAEVVGDCSSRRKVFYSFVTHTVWCAAHTQLSRSLLQRQWAQDVVGLLNRQLARISVGAVALGASFGVEDHVAYRAGAAHSCGPRADEYDEHTCHEKRASLG